MSKQNSSRPNRVQQRRARAYTAATGMSYQDALALIRQAHPVKPLSTAEEISIVASKKLYARWRRVTPSGEESLQATPETLGTSRRAFERMWVANLHLVLPAAKSVRSTTTPLIVRCRAANDALLVAIEQFDSNDAPFATYAERLMRETVRSIPAT